MGIKEKFTAAKAEKIKMQRNMNSKRHKYGQAGMCIVLVSRRLG